MLSPSPSSLVLLGLSPSSSSSVQMFSLRPDTIHVYYAAVLMPVTWHAVVILVSFATLVNVKVCKYPPADYFGGVH
ncbi:hypothetical protein SCHPADRAFT_741851 [Schizopora paradoxa]|uniref:Uncharacterized protein n=1 Tax=Schizopora paradoxa TaxID=27342 RepID=A0A0H2R0Z6_9AGAM|nr:hypothetical protein SCHPADRAFT_741851 [Schizopora paradoxa]